MSYKGCPPSFLFLLFCRFILMAKAKRSLPVLHHNQEKWEYQRGQDQGRHPILPRKLLVPSKDFGEEQKEGRHQPINQDINNRHDFSLFSAKVRNFQDISILSPAESAKKRAYFCCSMLFDYICVFIYSTHGFRTHLRL